LLAAAAGLDQPIWVVPGAVADGEPARPLAQRLSGTVAPATLPAATFAAMGSDDLTAARRQRLTGAGAASRSVAAPAGGVTDGLLPRGGLNG
jgi:hypothetical protein